MTSKDEAGWHVLSRKEITEPNGCGSKIRTQNGLPWQKETRTPICGPLFFILTRLLSAPLLKV